MSQEWWNFLFIFASFALYIGIAVASRATSTREYYVAGSGVSPFANGMATAADWMSAATFISMAGGIAVVGYDASRFLMGWTGGFVLLTTLMVPYLRKFGKASVQDFIVDRFYSRGARLAAVVCAIFICLTYIMGQMRGVGVVFSQLFEISPTWGVIIGGGIVFVYAAMGGMKGITYTQVAQYCVMAFSYTIPAVFASLILTGNIVPQLGLIGETVDRTGMEGQAVLAKIDQINRELGFSEYTEGKMSMLNLFCITAALMIGTAGLPHVIVRFFTVKNVRAVRTSACWTLAFIAVIYLTAPAVGVFARINLIENLQDVPREEAPGWLDTFEETGQMTWEDKNGDGRIQHRGPFSDQPNELTYGMDIMVMASPHMAGLSPWIIGLLMAGCIAAALSTAAGLLLVISTSISHDLMKKIVNPFMSDREEVRYARIASMVALVVAMYFGVNPPSDFVAQTVAFAFGLAASSFFPTLLMGIFFKRLNNWGAISGMVAGIGFTLVYIVYFQFGLPFVGRGTPEQYLWGVTPEGIGFFGMIINFVVATVVGLATPPPPREVMEMVDRIHIPRGGEDPSEGH